MARCTARRHPAERQGRGAASAAAAGAALLLLASLGMMQGPPSCLAQEQQQCEGGPGACTDGASDGGWDQAASPMLDTSFCNIRRVDLPRDASRLRSSSVLKRPVIFRRPDGAGGNAAARRATERHRLVEAHGGDTVVLSSANTYSYDKRRVPLAHYLEEGREYMGQHTAESLANETWYMFGDNDHGGWGDVFDAYAQPPYYQEHELLSGFETALSFGIGGSGTGVPFHVHGGGFSEVLWGRKRWFLTQEGVVPRFDPNRTTLYWLQYDYDKTVPANLSFLQGVYDCVIGPGEVLWFPANWYHATLNIGQTVFMSTFV